jgi:protein gp37
MGKDTSIEWAHHTFNPWWGCVKVSPACDHCYAETFARRVGYSETGSQFPIWGKDTERRVFGEKHWAEPLRLNRWAKDSGMRERVFCGSMCDVMEDHLEAERQRPLLYELIEQTPHLDWLLLTKRPQNFRRFLPKGWLSDPLQNVWLMTTVESQAQTWRAVELMTTPAAVRGLSCEPLLGPLDLTCIDYRTEGSGDPCSVDALSGNFRSLGGGGRLPRIDWVICGGESGHTARPMHPDWARSLRDQCQAAQVPFFFKQWGEWIEFSQSGLVEYPPACQTIQTRQSTRPKQCPEITLCRVGKKAAGRLLDGQEWNEVPA